SRCPHTHDVNERLQRYREYMARLDAAADPRHAIERGFYVPRSGRSIAEMVTGRVELRPASTHLVVGGTGSGKTTELFIARERLRKLADTTVIYIDISRRCDLSTITPQALLVLVGLAIGSHVDTNAPPNLGAWHFFRELAEDHFEPDVGPDP